jgi:peptidyl-prolyl isomerase F (cyclophilin D)
MSSGKPDFSWYTESPSQRLAFRATIAGAGAFIVYAAYKGWAEYFDPQALEHDEAVVRAIPLYKGNPVVFFDLALDDEDMGRVVFQLRKVSDPREGLALARHIALQDVAPLTVENFRRLCTGEPGYGYKGSRVHAVVPGSYIRGGDITHGSGLGGRSATGGSLPDEAHSLKHIGPGVLSMVSNGGPGNATSQFHIALSKSPFMDYQNLVFGNVLSGMEVLHEIEKRFEKGPGGNLVVKHCGELRRAHAERA